MPFSVDVPLLPEAITAAIVLEQRLPDLSSGQYIDHLYVHWSVEQWGCLDGAYNVEVDIEQGKWDAHITHDPRDNARDLQSGDNYAAHTFHRNSHALGIAITGMVGATTADFGPEALNVHGLEFLCAAAAACALRYKLDAAGTINGEFVIMTHAEAAIADHYFPGDGDPDSRWDLARFVASNNTLTKEEALANAALLRQRIHQYKTVIAR